MRFHLAIQGSFLEDSTAYSAFPGPFLEDSTLFRFSRLFLEDITSYSSFPGPFLEVILSPIPVFQACLGLLMLKPSHWISAEIFQPLFLLSLASQIFIRSHPKITYRHISRNNCSKEHQLWTQEFTNKIRSLQRLGHLVDSIKPELLCQYINSIPMLTFPSTSCPFQWFWYISAPSSSSKSSLFTLKKIYIYLDCLPILACKANVLVFLPEI